MLCAITPKSCCSTPEPKFTVLVEGSRLHKPRLQSSRCPFSIGLNCDCERLLLSAFFPFPSLKLQAPLGHTQGHNQNGEKLATTLPPDCVQIAH
jgi:hypothetical protein